MEDNKQNKEEKTKTLSEVQEEKLRAAMAQRKRRKRIKTIVAWVIVIAILFVLYTYYQSIKAKSQAMLDSMNQTVTVEKAVEEQNYSVSIDISGYVEPYDTQNAKFRSTGSVTGVYVSEGDYVAKGQLLASIDNTSQTSQLQSIRNQIEEAELTGNARQLELLRLQESTAVNNLDYTNIYANFDGVVTSVDVSEGDYFEAGSQVLTLVDISKLKATVEVDEIDMQYVYEGMEAYLTFDSLPGQTIVGRVSYIPMLGRYTSSGIGVVDVEITIDNPPKTLISGFSFEGNIYADGEVSMKIIPQAAVTTGRGGVTTVKKKQADGSTKDVVVNVKYLGEGLCQLISENVQVGDILVYNTKSTNNPMAMMMGPGGR